MRAWDGEWMIVVRVAVGGCGGAVAGTSRAGGGSMYVVGRSGVVADVYVHMMEVVVSGSRSAGGLYRYSN